MQNSIYPVNDINDICTVFLKGILKQKQNMLIYLVVNIGLTINNPL